MPWSLRTCDERLSGRGVFFFFFWGGGGREGGEGSFFLKKWGMGVFFVSRWFGIIRVVMDVVRWFEYIV